MAFFVRKWFKLIRKQKVVLHSRGCTQKEFVWSCFTVMKTILNLLTNQLTNRHIITNIHISINYVYLTSRNLDCPKNKTQATHGFNDL